MRDDILAGLPLPLGVILQHRLHLVGPVVRTLALVSVVAPLGVACVEVIPLERAEVPDAGVLDAHADVQADGVDDVEGSADPVGPAVEIVAPADGTRLNTATVRIEGVAHDDSGLATIAVQVASNAPVLADSNDGYRTWWADVPVARGPFEVRAWGYDVNGLRSTDEDAILLQGPSITSDDGAPHIEIIEPADASLALQPLVLVRGTTEDDGGVVRIDVFLNGEPLDERPVETDSFFAEWVRLVPLLPGEANVLEFVAFDRRGAHSTASITVTGRGIDDREPPELRLETPRAGETLTETMLTVRGRAVDEAGIRQVEVRAVRAGDDGEDIATNWQPASSFDAFATFEASLELVAGEQTIEVRAVDLSGLSTSVVVAIDVDVIDEYGTERVVRLRLRPDVAQPPVTLRVGRDRIGEVLSEEIQREILMLELDPTDLLTNTMNAIKTACGTAWRNDSASPNHDCSLTELGRTFRGADGTWRTSPEYALVRLLTMTPANVQVAGTSIAGLQELADGSFFGITIGGGFGQILADSLGISRTTEITGTEAVVQALREYLIATHPAATPDGRMPVTLHDALNDMRPLGERFGPAGDHPGVVDPAVAAYGQVFEDDSAMVLTASSNLQWIDGVDLLSGKEYMAVVVDRIGPTFNDVIEFDFSSDETFRVEGLVERPVTDMRFQVYENDLFVPSCNGSTACTANLPGSPSSPSSYWAQPRHQLESIIARAAYLQYQGRRSLRCYINFLGCQAEVRIGQGSFPAGWTEFYIILGLGNPPRDQYIWELITEVGQVALHRVPAGTLAEGTADVAFDLKGIEVGITADELQEIVRPYLQAQAASISDLVLGNYRTNNGNLDFYYRRGDDGLPYLYFVAPDDPRPVDDGYPYTRPGFFAEPSLAEASRLSMLDIPGSGDAAHHKLPITPGIVEVFAQDRNLDVWRLRITATDEADELVIRAARRLP